MQMPPVLPHQLTTNVKFLHKAALIHENKVLILRRADGDGSRPGCWDLPGGNSEWPASVTAPTADLHAQDIAREIQEETGYQIASANFANKTPVFFRSFFEPEKQLYSVICGWMATADQVLAFRPDQVILSPEHTAFAWVTQAELDSYDFGGVKGEFIKASIVEAFAHVKQTPTAAY